MACVERVSLPYRLRSSTSTRSPRRASRNAVAAPAARAPTTTTSYASSVGPRCRIVVSVRSGGVDVDRHRHAVADDVVDSGALPRLLDDLTEPLRVVAAQDEV